MQAGSDSSLCPSGRRAGFTDSVSGGDYEILTALAERQEKIKIWFS